MSPLTVGNEDHRFMVLDQLREVGGDPGRVLLEPMGRNTAPAMTLAALEARGGGETDPVLVVKPADNVIPDTAAFAHAMREAVRAAAGGAVVILGVEPDRPETGYGYIHSDPKAEGARPVRRFVEKLDLATAERCLAEGGYHWNAGMFVVRASVWLYALQRIRPDILDAIRVAWKACVQDDRFVGPDKKAFAAVPAESVDFAVMERCPGSGIDTLTVPLEAGWNDLGAWDAVWRVARKGEAGNAALGEALVTDSRNTLVRATSRLVSLVVMDV